MEANYASVSTGERDRGQAGTTKRGCGGLRKLEIVLIVILILTLLCLFIVCIAWAIKEHNGKPEKEDVCQTERCLIVASDIMSSMDLSLDPCDDFYDYVCKKKFDGVILNENNKDRITPLMDDMNLMLKYILSQETPLDELPEHAQKAVTFYKTCMDTGERDSDGLSDFLSDLQEFGGFPVLMGTSWDEQSFDFIECLKKMKDKGYIKGVLITSSAGYNLQNNSIEDIMFSQSELVLELKDYYKREDITDVYADFLVELTHYICQELGASCHEKKINKKEIRDALAVEIRLASFMAAPEEIVDKEKTYNMMSYSDLQNIAPGINWPSLIKVFFPNFENGSQKRIMIITPPFMTNIAQYIKSLDSTVEGRRSLANYLMYRTSIEAALNINMHTRRMYHNFKNLIDQEVDIPVLWKECLKSTRAVFDLSLSNMYAKQFFPKKRRDALVQMIEELRTELQGILERTSWMDEYTIKGALKKLHSLYAIAGYPEDLLNDGKLSKWYKKLEIGAKHFENFKNGNIFINEIENAYMQKEHDKTSWKNLPEKLLVTNAGNLQTNNSIFIPLGMLHESLFQEDNPKYVNYGRMGFILAHEFGHTFDTSGADYDYKGNWKNWWRKDTMQHFKNSCTCMVKLFDSYYLKEANKTVNGTQTLMENVADDLGVAEAYLAYVKASEIEPDLPLPGIDLNTRQLFWVNLASTWCEKKDSDDYVEIIRSDEHSPARFRVNSPLSNSDDFLRDFGCPAESKMNQLEHECHTWGV